MTDLVLAIDCGNTNTVFGLASAEEAKQTFAHTFRMDTNAALAARDYEARFHEELAARRLDNVSVRGAVMASVVPGATEELSAFATALAGRLPVVVGAPGVELGIEVRVDDPAEVGADRLVNALAAHDAYPGPLIVVDFGTATTFDVVGSGGAYEGGVIAPGINLALDALHEAAALLPRPPVARPPAVIGTGTVSAMQSGIYWGYMGLIEGIVRRIKDEYASDAPFTTIATGGLAPLFAEGTDAIDGTEPDLTLKGLVLVYRRNAAS